MLTARDRSKPAYHILFLVLLAAATWRCYSQQAEDACSSQSAASHTDPMASYRYPRASDRSTGLVRELLSPFPLEEFAKNYWERMPLVVRGRSLNHYKRLVDFGVGDVDIVIKNGVSLSGGGEDYMISGSDWNVIKRVFVKADGEFWSAGLPLKTSQTTGPSSSSWDTAAAGHADTATAAGAAAAGGGGRGEGSIAVLKEAWEAFNRGGFSIVINRLQRRWRGVSEVSLALEDVLGHPVNANMYMTPPDGQGFEAHFDWMDGIVVQLAGSKTWILYDEIMAAPRPDLKFKPAAADLGEPIAVLELHPGDLMYIPRGWPHEAAVNGTKNADTVRSRGAREPSIHVTFGIESALAGTYESLLHHALQVAAAEDPDLFGLAHERKTKVDEGAGGVGKGEKQIFPWLQLVHLWLHDTASRDARLRKAVPLAPLFSPPSLPSTTDASTPTGGGDDDDTSRVCASDAAAPTAPAPPPAAILKEFWRALEAFSVISDSADESSASSLLESLSDEHKVEQVLGMFQIQASGADEGERGGRRAAAGGFSAGLDRGEGLTFSWTEGWDRTTLEAFDLATFPASLKAKVAGFLKAASAEGAVKNMVKAATTRARERAAMTERDLARCGQG